MLIHQNSGRRKVKRKSIVCIVRRIWAEMIDKKSLTQNKYGVSFIHLSPDVCLVIFDLNILFVLKFLYFANTKKTALNSVRSMMQICLNFLNIINKTKFLIYYVPKASTRLNDRTDMSGIIIDKGNRCH